MMVHTASNQFKDDRSGRFSARGVGAVCLAITTCVLGCFKVGNWMIANDFFAFEGVLISGTKFADKSELLTLTAIDSTKHIFQIDLKAIAEQVGRHPLVKTAVVGRKYPGMIAIRVTEREPVAVLNQGRRGLAPIDEEGTLLTEFPVRMLSGYPIISRVEIAPNTGKYGAELSKAIDFVLQMKKHHSTIYDNISEISYSRRFGIYILLADFPIPVFWGDGEFVGKGEKFMIFKREILGNQDALSQLEYVDLRFANQIVVKEGRKS